MEITLTPTQYEKLKVLMVASQNPISQAGTTSVELQVDGSKVEYNSTEIKFVIAD